MRRLVVVLAISGFFGAVACGSRSGIGLFDETGDAGSDVAVEDVAMDTVSDRRDAVSDTQPGDARLTDAPPDAAEDVVEDMVVEASPSCPEPGDSGTEPPSCQPGGPGMTNCGACRESCCTSLDVPGGTYFRTYVNDGSGPTGEADPATVSSFRLDKYLATVGRFRRFVAAWDGGAGYAPADGSGKHTHLNGGQGLENSAVPGTYESGWNAKDWNTTAYIDPTNANLSCVPPFETWTQMPGNQENLPINCVNWFEAYAFCIWDGGFLPSEAEWEYAAGGGSQPNGQREYPWGSTAPGTTNAYAIYALYYSGNPTSLAPVGTTTLGAAMWGQFDLAGEVWEWNLDWLANYAPCTDCAFLTPTSFQVLRGGNFNYHGTSVLLATVRLGEPPTNGYYYEGFRCARAP